MNCRDDRIDPLVYSFPPMWYSNINKYHARCDAIEKQLCKNGLKARVSRHTCFDVDYYVVEEWDNKTDFDAEDIADALDIPFDWVSLANYMDGISVFWIKEKELHKKYLKCGELILNANGILIEQVKKHLDDDELICGNIDMRGNDIEIKLSMRRK